MTIALDVKKASMRPKINTKVQRLQAKVIKCRRQRRDAEIKVRRAVAGKRSREAAPETQTKGRSLHVSLNEYFTIRERWEILNRYHWIGLTKQTTKKVPTVDNSSKNEGGVGDWKLERRAIKGWRDSSRRRWIAQAHRATTQRPGDKDGNEPRPIEGKRPTSGN